MITLPPKLNNYLWISRKQLGWSRKRLAGFIGHETTSQLSRWEDGSQIPTLANALLLAHLLSRPVEELFTALREEVVRQAEERRRESGEDDIRTGG